MNANNLIFISRCSLSLTQKSPKYHFITKIQIGTSCHNIFKVACNKVRVWSCSGRCRPWAKWGFYCFPCRLFFLLPFFFFLPKAPLLDLPLLWGLIWITITNLMCLVSLIIKGNHHVINQPVLRVHILVWP